ncbi:MAG: hypothetical protein M1831_006707 [Alyxoria varia]|nr:MAG: hypothetical protein M1831_006707 [Alyxoria varia]
MVQRLSLWEPLAAIEAIEKDGGVIITDFATADEVAKVTADAAPHLRADATEHEGKRLEPTMRRCYHLFGISETAREQWMQQPKLLEILRHFLGTKSRPYNDSVFGKIATDPILSAANTLDILPGAGAQALHRDDFIWQQKHESHEQTGYCVGSDVGMGILVPGVKTTADNGATFVIKGSHLWDHARVPDYAEATRAEMDVGEAFIFLSSTVHAGGGNQTEQQRPVHGFFFCRSYIRPEASLLFFSISFEWQPGGV